MSSPLLPRVLLTNDDGFDAPGLATLAEVAQTLAEEVWIVAPQLDQSGMGQSISVNGPLRCHPRGEKQWAITGTPADCVILALTELMTDTRPSLVLSGINAGANTGDDINLSGTLGAAFTSLMFGIPSIGISLDCASRRHLRWQTARDVLPRILISLLAQGWASGTCLSLNIPDLPTNKIGPLRWARPAQKTLTSFLVEKREDLREREYYWLHPKSDKTQVSDDSDVGVLSEGCISISALALDRSAPMPHLNLVPIAAND